MLLGHKKMNVKSKLIQQTIACLLASEFDVFVVY